MRISRHLREKRREILEVAKRHGARDLRLFGSAARGEMRPGSDLDVLVKLGPGRSLLDIVAVKQDLEDLLGCEVDVVTEAGISPYMREQILGEAVEL